MWWCGSSNIPNQLSGKSAGYVLEMFRENFLLGKIRLELQAIDIGKLGSMNWVRMTLVQLSLEGSTMSK